MTLRRRLLAILVLGCAAIPAARADAQTKVAYTGYFTPFLGLTAGDDAEDPGFTAGASLAVTDAEGWGAEVDFGHATTLGDDRFRDSGLTSGMVNLFYLWPHVGIQPFGIAGAGVMRVSGALSLNGDRGSRTDWAWMGGGGVHIPLNEVFAIRGDVRYMRFFESHPDVPVPGGGAFGTWRFAAGLTLNWPLEP